MHPGEHSLHSLPRGSQALGDLVQRADQIAGLIQTVDQRRADHPLCRIDQNEACLALEMLLQRDSLGHVGLEIAALRLNPLRRLQRRAHEPIESVSPVMGSAAGALWSASKAFSISVPRFAASAALSVSSESGRPVSGFRRALGCWRFRRAFEALGLSRTSLSSARSRSGLLASSFSMKAESSVLRHLQQLYRLKQLRRQNHRLTLPHRQFGRKRH